MVLNMVENASCAGEGTGLSQALKDRMMKIAGSVGKMVGESAPLLQRSRVGSALSFFFDFFEVE